MEPNIYISPKDDCAGICYVDDLKVTGNLTEGNTVNFIGRRFKHNGEYITITLTDGRVIRGSADFGRGSPAMPMSYDEVADKFRENCEFAKFSSQRANQVVEMIRGIEKVGSIRELTALLAI